MQAPLLLVDRAMPGCAVLTLNRPKAKNALSRALRAELVATLDALAQEPQLRVLVLTGAGDAFCAGLDLKELGSGVSGAALGLDDPLSDPVAAIERFPGPVIGAVNGVAITGGFELALACDVLLVTPSARFADTHARVGVVPFWGLSQKLSRLIGPMRARELSLTGNFISATQAEAWGLVNHVVHADQLLDCARRLAADMLTVLPEMLLTYKKLINDGYQLPFGAALSLEKQRAQEAAKDIDLAALELRREAVRVRGQQQTTISQLV